jgi:glycosyltransferase involved in cell wall biosynthesis
MRVVAVHFSSPGAYPPLMRALEALCVRGHHCRLLGTLSGASYSAALPAIEGLSANILARRSHRLALPFAMCWLLLKCTLAAFSRPHWVYASDPLSLPAARWLSWLSGARLLYQEHDSPQPDEAPRSWFWRWLLRLRVGTLKRADISVFPNQQRLELAHRQAGVGAGQQFLLWNVPALKELPELHSKPEQRPERLLLHFHGSISEVRLPEQIIEALASDPRVELQIVGYDLSGRNIVEQLLARARALGAGDRVRYLGPITDRQQLMRVAASADVGIGFVAVSAKNYNHFTGDGASNKIFEYLGAGLALLCNNSPQWQEFVPRFGIAVDPYDVDALKQAFQRFLADSPSPRRLGAEGHTQIQKVWNFECAFAPLLQLLEATTP